MLLIYSIFFPLRIFLRKILTRSLPTTSYLVVLGFFIFANYEITRTTLFLIFHLFTQKRLDFIIFVGKLKTQRIWAH